MRTTSRGLRYILSDVDKAIAHITTKRTVICALHALTISATLVLSRASWAQDVDRLPNAAIRAAIAQSARSGGSGVAFSTSNDNAAQFLLNRRTTPSAIEMHCAWDDLVIVKEGSGTLRSSRKFRGLFRYATWEWRAKELAVAREVPMEAGDVLRVASGVGHQVVPTSTVPLVYLVIKVRSAEATPCGSLPRRGQ